MRSRAILNIVAQKIFQNHTALYCSDNPESYIISRVIVLCGGPGPSACTPRRSRLNACFNHCDYCESRPVTRGVVSRPSIGLTWEGDLLGKTFGSREGQLLLSSIGTNSNRSHCMICCISLRREGTSRSSDCKTIQHRHWSSARAIISPW